LTVEFTVSLPDVLAQELNDRAFQCGYSPEELIADLVRRHLSAARQYEKGGFS